MLPALEGRGQTVSELRAGPKSPAASQDAPQATLCSYLDQAALLTFGQRFLDISGIFFKYKVKILDPSRSWWVQIPPGTFTSCVPCTSD